MLSAPTSSDNSPTLHSDQLRSAKIRALNDAFRRRLPRPTKGCRLIVTRGMGSFTIEQFASFLNAVSTYANFDLGNDPHGEHDFCSLEQDCVTYVWKIDSYDRSMQFGSPDPADPTVTTGCSRSCAPMNRGPIMKKRYWILGGLAIFAVATQFSGDSSSLCSTAAAKNALNQGFTSRLARLGAKLLDDFAVHGEKGDVVMCSVSFSIKPTPEAAVGSAPTTAADMQGYAMVMMPNLMMQAQTNPGHPLVQRVSYRANKTLDDRVLVTVMDFPGARNLR